MLRALAGISPVLVLLLGMLPAGGIGYAAATLKFAFVDEPAVRREVAASAAASCALQVGEAATQAEEAERARQRQINNDALSVYRTALANSERAASLAAERLDKEVAYYEAQLLDQGRFCSITQPDIDFMFGRIPQSGPIRR